MFTYLMSRKCQIAIKVYKCYESHSLRNLLSCLSTCHGMESVPYWHATEGHHWCLEKYGKMCFAVFSLYTLMSAEIATDSSLATQGLENIVASFAFSSHFFRWYNKTKVKMMMTMIATVRKRRKRKKRKIKGSRRKKRWTPV